MGNVLAVGAGICGDEEDPEEKNLERQLGPMSGLHLRSPSQNPARGFFGARGGPGEEEDPLEAIIGDYRTFIDSVADSLLTCGLDARARGFEIDHICYRTASREEYRYVMDQLVPHFGTKLIESPIGGRLISTVQLTEPVRHSGFTVSCIEVPAPKASNKASKAYVSGLEHAELVVGQPGDGVVGRERLQAFVANSRKTLPGLAAKFDFRAFGKDCNPDVSVSFGDIQVKFHQRPLYEVIAYELRQQQREMQTSAKSSSDDGDKVDPRRPAWR